MNTGVPDADRQIFLGQVEKDKERRVNPQIEALSYNSSLVMSH
jgi:hypothetical protein